MKSLAPFKRAPGATFQRALPGLAGSLLLAATTASACPQCAGRDDGGVGPVIALGAMILLPFAIAALAWPVIRRGPART